MLNCCGRQISITKVHVRPCDPLQRIKDPRTVVNFKHIGLHQRQQFRSGISLRMLVDPRKDVEGFGNSDGRDCQSNLSRLRARKQSCRGRGLLCVVIPQKAEHDVGIEMITRTHLFGLPLSLISAHPKRALLFSPRSRAFRVWAEPKSDMMSGTGLTCALPSGKSSQTTSADFQRARNFAGIVVCPLLDI